MSASRKQLFTRNGNYYFRQWIPLDLRPLYGERIELVRSLKTTDKKQAHSLALGLQQKYSVTFSLLRSDLLSPEVVQALVSDSRPRRKSVSKRITVDTPTPSRSLILSNLFALYTKEHSPAWTEKSRQEFAGQFRLLLMILDDKPIDKFSRDSCVDCRDILLKIPPGFTKKKELRDLSLPDLLSLNLSGLTPKTVNKHMVLLSSLFKWAVTHGHMERNPAQGLTLEIHKKADEERKAYDKEDIKRILKHLPPDPVKQWIPMIALYSGMRLEEICQLTAEDVKAIDGVLCFDVNNNGDKHLKTESSVRVIPVHPELMRLGLMDYLKERPSSSNLWGLSRGKWGYGKRFTNWWSTCFNRQYVTDDPLKCFHSCRHSFANTLKQLGVQESIISELMGHANGSITTGRYGKRYRAEVLLEAIKKVDYAIQH